MDDQITAGGITDSRPLVSSRRLIPMQIGNATVFIEQIDEPEVVANDEIYPVALNPRQAFENASEVLRECVRVVGDRLEQLAEKSRPQEVTVEFSLSFEVKGKASFIPVFVTGETATQTGLKVTAKWKTG